MVVRVAERARRAAGIDEVAVATDDERIAQAARDLPADGYLNVQGDEPLIDPRAITQVAELLRSGAEMATLARPLEPGEAARPEVVKVVVDARQCALYFSRSLIPYPRREGEVAPLAHIGIYGFSAQTLQRFARLAETPLERAEGLEQLRALWHGIPIEVGVVDHRPAAVDTPEDLERVRRLFAEEQRRNG